MSKSVLAPAKFLASIWADLLKAFWDERGGGARYRTVNVGVDFLAAQIQDRPPTMDRTEALDRTAAIIQETGVADSVEYELHHDFADHAELKVKGCIFHAGELALREKGCEPYACVVGNLAMHLVESEEFSPELARIHVDHEGCKVQVVFFQNLKSEQ